MPTQKKSPPRQRSPQSSAKPTGSPPSRPLGGSAGDQDTAQSDAFPLTDAA